MRWASSLPLSPRPAFATRELDAPVRSVYPEFGQTRAPTLRNTQMQVQLAQSLGHMAEDEAVALVADLLRR